MGRPAGKLPSSQETLVYEIKLFSGFADIARGEKNEFI
jgi:hypothetical protein